LPGGFGFGLGFDFGLDFAFRRCDIIMAHAPHGMGIL
jgi:hypothetical protein